MYYVRKLNLKSNTDLCDKLAQKSGELCTQTIPVDALMARASGVRFDPHITVAHGLCL